MQSDSMSKDESLSQMALQQREKSSFEKLLNNIKNSTFAVLFVLLKEEPDTNLLLFIVPTIFDYLQILQFIFHQKVNHLWNANDVFTQVFNFFSFFDLGKYFGELVTWQLYLVSFYFFIFLILFIIIDIVYVSISFNRKKFTAIWPLVILRNFVNIAVTVLFLFITEILISMVECSRGDDDKFHHTIFKDVICFTGWHIFHTVISVIFNVIFMTISLIVVRNYFESRISAKTRQARANSKAGFWFVVNKITLQVLFTFFTSDWLLSIAIFIGGMFLAYYYVYDDPFYNIFVAKFYKMLSSLYFWSCCVLLILKLLSSTGFGGGFILWAAGVPFVMFLSVSFSKNSMKTISNSHIKYYYAQDLVDHTQYVLKLIEGHDKNKQYYLFLIGYIQKHKEICLESDCPLKLIKNHEAGDRIEFKESLTALLQVLDRLYESGIKKFKKSIPLRISYAFFLLERMSNKKKALYELKYAEELGPSFDKEFLIYRYKKIIEDSLNDNAKINGEDQEVDIVGMIAFETHLKMVVHFVKKSAEYHKDFWSELLKEKADLSRLNILGTNINFTIKNTKENWFKLVKINGNIPTVLKLYSRFLTLVLNEKENGKKLMNQFKNLVMKHKNIKFSQLVEMTELPNSIALAFVGYHNGELGYIKRINIEFSALLGYTEEEIINQKIEVLIPEMFKVSHAEYISNLLRSADKKSDYLEREIASFCKTKKGFIIPVKTKVTAYYTDSIDNNIYFVVSIKPEHILENRLCLLTNKNGVIQDMTTNVVSFLNLDLLKIKERRININNYLPKAIVLREYRVRGTSINLKLNDGTFTDTLCFMEPVMLKQVIKQEEGPTIISEERELEGYIARIQLKLTDKVSDLVKNQLKQTEVNMDGFDIPLDIWEHIPSHYTTHLLSKTRNDLKKRTMSVTNYNQDDTQFTSERIITKRLRNGEITDLASYKFYEDEMESRSNIIKVNLKRSVFKDKLDQYEKQNIDENNKIRKDQLNSIIVRENKNIVLRAYKLVAILWFVSLFVTGELQFNRTAVSYNTLTERFNFVQLSAKNVDYHSTLFTQSLRVGMIKRKIHYRDLSVDERKAIIEEIFKTNEVYTLLINDYLKIKNNFSDGIIYNLIKDNYKNYNHNTDMQTRFLNEQETINKEIYSTNNQSNETTLINQNNMDANVSKYTIIDSGNGFKDDKEMRIYTITDLFTPLTFVNVTRSDPNGSKNVIETLKYSKRTMDDDTLFDKETKINYFDFNMHCISTMFNRFHQSQLYQSESTFIVSLIKSRKLIEETIFDGYLSELKTHIEMFKNMYDTIFITDQVIIVLLGVSLITTIIFLMYIYSLVKMVYLKIEIVLTLFLDIPRREVIDIKKRCDAFVSYSSEFNFDNDQQKRIVLESSDEEEEIDKEIQIKVDKLMRKKTEDQNFSRCKLIRSR